MCFSGKCRHEIGSGPKRGECSGRKPECPIFICDICGCYTYDGSNTCEGCKRKIEDCYD